MQFNRKSRPVASPRSLTPRVQPASKGDESPFTPEPQFLPHKRPPLPLR